MIQDGYGYGKSDCWLYHAKKIAHDQGESCGHDIQVQVGYEENLLNHNVKMIVQCDNCDNKFEKTCAILTRKFLEFYGK